MTAGACSLGRSTNSPARSSSSSSEPSVRRSLSRTRLGRIRRPAESILRFIPVIMAYGLPFGTQKWYLRNGLETRYLCFFGRLGVDCYAVNLREMLFDAVL